MTLQAQVTSDLSIAGQWFYNWQAVRAPESGSYLTVNDGLQFGGDSLILGANPFAAAVPGSPALLRAWNSQAVAQSRYSASLGDWGISARWSPAWLDGTLGFYYRNATDILPQIALVQGFAALPAGTCNAIGGIVVAPGACIINRNATSVADLTQKGKVGTYATAYGDNIHIMGITLSKNIARRERRRRVFVSAEHAAVERPGAGAAGAACDPAPGAISTASFTPGQGTPGALGNTYHGIVNVLGTIAKTPLFDSATYAGRVDLDALGQGDPERGGVPGPRKLHGDQQGLARFRRPCDQLHADLVPGIPGVDILAPLSWSRGLYGNAAVFAGGNEDAGNWSVGVAADVYSKYRFDLKYTAYFGNYTTNPVTGAVNVFNGLLPSCPTAAGGRSRPKQRFKEDHDHVLQIHTRAGVGRARRPLRSQGSRPMRPSSWAAR